MQRLEINAVHERDLQTFLESIGQYAKFKGGELKCFVCGDTLGIANLGAVLSVKGEARFVCTKIECLNKTSLESTQEQS